MRDVLDPDSGGKSSSTAAYNADDLTAFAEDRAATHPGWPILIHNDSWPPTMSGAGYLVNLSWCRHGAAHTFVISMHESAWHRGADRYPTISAYPKAITRVPGESSILNRPGLRTSGAVRVRLKQI